jgi:hypothetical protein
MLWKMSVRQCTKVRIACALGVGMRPKTLRSSLQIPATLSRFIARGVRRAPRRRRREAGSAELEAMKDGVIRKIAAFTASDGNLKNGSIHAAFVTGCCGVQRGRGRASNEVQSRFHKRAR